MIHVGDCLTVMRTMPDQSFNAVVTDPPYEIGFMGKAWDANGVAYRVEVWAECLRLLKPGGHLLAFGGSRTYHRLACAIEDAGFEIRDQIMWVYGSGFPKSLDVSKAIDKMHGVTERPVISEKRGAERMRAQTVDGRRSGEGTWGDESHRDPFVRAAVTDDARCWKGWGTALKPAHEPIVVARKPLDGTVAETVLAHGTGALNIDGCRVGNEVVATQHTVGGYRQGREKHKGTGEISLHLGRFPANFIHDGSDEVLELFPEAKDEGGSAARFFYCAKASRAEREAGLDDFDPKRESDRIADDLPVGDNPRNRTNTGRRNHHPTVKPIALMRYLVRLVTPPNGVVLDPFTGSGTTGIAAQLEGFKFVGIEQSAEYADIAQARINHA
jgi:site-specific DNA-methyltransferase (adenine-specific)